MLNWLENKKGYSKMTKSKFVKGVLIPELEWLMKVKNVVVLTETASYNEVTAILRGIDYSIFNEYMEKRFSTDFEDFVPLDIKDIPHEYVETFALYLYGSDFGETEVMQDWLELQEALYQSSKIGPVIARKMDTHTLNDFKSLAELMSA